MSLFPSLRRSPVLVAASAAVLFGLSWSAAPRAQSELPKIWTGVYTEAQANRGRDVFNNRCAHCHDEHLTGGDGPSLVAAHFNRNWGSRTVERLFSKIKNRMPPGEVFIATDQEKLDITSYLLMMNGFPAGPKDLPMDMPELSSILIVGKDGPQPAPTGAMVEVLGCLLADGSDYVIGNATEPVVSTMDDPAADAAAAKTRSLGSARVKLLDVYPKPDAHKGHKMLAKGLLIRNGAAMSLNVLAIDMVAETCP
ncbi:MAG: cytochrome c [Vicinamibacterales bacterium]